MIGRRALLLVVVAAAIAAYFATDAGRFLNLDFIRAQQAALEGEVAAAPFTTGAAFMAGRGAAPARRTSSGRASGCGGPSHASRRLAPSATSRTSGATTARACC